VQRPRIDIRTSSAVLGAALLLSLLAFFACVGATTARADAAPVTVVSPGGAEQTLALEALAGKEDVVGRSYVLRGGTGESRETVTGFSLQALIEAAKADPLRFTYLEVQRPSGGAVLLDNQAARSNSGDGPPAIYASANGTAFLRPSAGAEDLNADDFFSAPQGIRIVLHDEPLLQVEAKASTLQTKPGKPVEFSAVVKRAGAGEELSYSWTFEGGGRASGPEATHEFAERGSYKVVLGVTSAGNPTGSSDFLTIQVGAPSGGPDRQGGGRSKRKDAPEHGLADGPSTGSSEGGGTGLPAAPASGGEAVAPTPQPETAAPVEPAPEPEGEEVSGELLTASTTPPEEEEKQQLAEARSGSLDGEGDSGGDVPTAAWGGLATLGLLGLGGLLEARGLGGLLPGRRHGGIA